MDKFSPEDIEAGYNKPISTSDAAAMLRRKVARNGKPYDTAVIQGNNRLVDKWKKEVLDKMNPGSRTLPAGRVWPSWQLYNEGTNCYMMRDMVEAGFFPEPPKNVLEFWKAFFETSSVEELHSYGSGTVSMGWTIIQNYFKLWFMKEKYDKFFSQSDDPLWWEKNHHTQAAVLNGEVFPFWSPEELKEIHEKILPVLSIQVQPDTTNYSRLI